jgi:hypothetical protein
VCLAFLRQRGTADVYSSSERGIYTYTTDITGTRFKNEFHIRKSARSSACVKAQESLDTLLHNQQWTAEIGAYNNTELPRCVQCASKLARRHTVVRKGEYSVVSNFTKCIRCLILCSVDRACLFNLFQMKPTGCTLLLNIFISNSLHVSGNYVPIIRRTYRIYATLIFYTLYGWLTGL